METSMANRFPEPDAPIIEKYNERRVDGRTKAGRAARAAQVAQAQQALASRPSQRQAPVRPSMTEATRKNVRDDGQVLGRNGEVLSRKRTGAADPFAIDPAIIPQGWEYQWNAITVVGNQEVLMDQQLQMAENGWRPVPAERHPGRFMPAGHKGSIIRGGQRLDERPKILSDQARAEDLRNARQLISDRNESLRLTGLKKAMPEGFAMNQKRFRGTGGDIRMSIDKGLDIPRPEHTLADPGEE